MRSAKPPPHPWIKKLGDLVGQAICEQMIIPATCAAVLFRTSNYGSIELHWSETLDLKNLWHFKQACACAVPEFLDAVDLLEIQAWNSQPERGDPEGGFAEHSRLVFSAAVKELQRRFRDDLISAIRAVIDERVFVGFSQWMPVCFVDPEGVHLLQVLCPLIRPEDGPYLPVKELRTDEEWQKPSSLTAFCFRSYHGIHLYYPRGQTICFADKDIQPCQVFIPFRSMDRLDACVTAEHPNGEFEIIGDSRLYAANYEDVNAGKVQSVILTASKSDLVALVPEVAETVERSAHHRTDESSSKLTAAEIAEIAQERVSVLSAELAQVEFGDHGLGLIVLSESGSLSLYGPHSILGPQKQPLFQSKINPSGWQRAWSQQLELNCAIMEGIAALPLCQQYAAGRLRLVSENFGIVRTMLRADRPWVPYRSPFMACTPYQVFLLGGTRVTDQQVTEARKSPEKQGMVRAYARLGISRALQLASAIDGCPAEVYAPAERILNALEREFPTADAKAQAALIRSAEKVATAVVHPALERALLVDIVMGSGEVPIRELAWDAIVRILAHHQRETDIRQTFSLMPTWARFAMRALRDPQIGFDLKVVEQISYALSSYNGMLWCRYSDFMYFPVATRSLIDAILERCRIIGRADSFQPWSKALISWVVSMIDEKSAPESWRLDVEPLLTRWYEDKEFDVSFREFCNPRRYRKP